MPTRCNEFATADIEFTLTGFSVDTSAATAPTVIFPFATYHRQEPSRTAVSATAVHVEASVFNTNNDALVGVNTVDVTLSGELASPESILSDMQAALNGLPIDIYDLNTIHALRYRLTDGAVVFECAFGFGPGGAATRGVGQVFESVDIRRLGYGYDGLAGTGGFSNPLRTRLQLVAAKTKIFRNAKVCIFPVIRSAVPCQKNIGDPVTNLRDGVLVPDAMPTDIYNGGALATAEDPNNRGGWQIPPCCQ